ncbi:hypothetical protein, variant [Aphanomyces invadans]|uniref:Uncharacterized protein n=1 Tax=Aphanomyces invadans TaxID=157072 RepID=A0A024TR97_9STRA|nr:hypothetical protein H310_10233 [Aphanomyces invadans]XP_008874777.1 hypothetical protein, variant [Aphanomyces invadans]ETV96513.1 hypothetical protein H310_10233 [Aphanomyces invadans]ETV96514.1 hypothetical protein, variant [Aphanomyces invadans]|eukprot:XP_008874776.1 hypothetical protein H310_10233 [Aphanomyces invadans]
MSALGNRRGPSPSTGPQEASSATEDLVVTPCMGLLRPKRFLPDENQQHDDGDAVASPANKKRAVVEGSKSASFPTLPYPSSAAHPQYPATLPRLSLPKINPVVLVLKKRPLDIIQDVPPTNIPQNPPHQQCPQQPSRLSQHEQPQQQAPKLTPPPLQSEKLQSVLRGLVHVAQCPDGCSNKLCQSTSGFVSKVRTHLTSQPASHDRSGCGACKLWKSIVDEHEKDCLDPHCPIPLCKRTLYM